MVYLKGVIHLKNTTSSENTSAFLQLSFSPIIIPAHNNAYSRFSSETQKIQSSSIQTRKLYSVEIYYDIFSSFGEIGLWNIFDN